LENRRGRGGGLGVGTVRGKEPIGRLRVVKLKQSKGRRKSFRPPKVATKTENEMCEQADGGGKELRREKRKAKGAPLTARGVRQKLDVLLEGQTKTNSATGVQKGIWGYVGKPGGLATDTRLTKGVRSRGEGRGK